MRVPKNYLVKISTCCLIFICITSTCTTLHNVNAFLPQSTTKNSHSKKIYQQHIPQSYFVTNTSNTKLTPLQASSIPNRGGGGDASTSSSIISAIDIPRISVTVAGTYLTWLLQQQGYTNVMASSALTLICCMLSTNASLCQGAFCGTFAGMASKTIIPSWYSALGLGLLTSSLYEVLIESKNKFVGVGGRLGATAFIASLIIAFTIGTPTGLSLSLSSLPSFNVIMNHLVQNKDVILSMSFWHAVGSIGTILCRENGDDTTAKSPVRASAVIGLMGALFLTKNKSAALAVYGGSFIGMSAPPRLVHGILPGQDSKAISTVRLLSAFAIAGALGGMVHGLTIGLGWFNGGWGGKAGFCAFLGCLLYRGVHNLVK